MTQCTSDTSWLLQGCELLSTVTLMRNLVFLTWLDSKVLFTGMCIYRAGLKKKKTLLKKNSAFYCVVQRYHEQ